MSDSQVLVAYDSLLVNSTVRELLSKVVFDNNTETLGASPQSELLKLLPSLLPEKVLEARIAIKNFINGYFFEPKYSPKLYYEKLSSFKKLVVVAMVLESQNLKNMGGIPTLLDIPQSYAIFAAEICTAEKWTSLREQYETEHLNNCNTGKKYCDIYIN